MDSYHQWSVSCLEDIFEKLFYFLGRCHKRLVCFSTSCIVSLGRHFMPCCNITEHINWSNWNNVFLPLNCWRGRRYSLTVNLHLRSYGSLKDYLFFKDNVSACLNLSLTKDVDLGISSKIHCYPINVSFLPEGSSLDFFSLGTWKYTGHQYILKCSISGFTPVKASSKVMFLQNLVKTHVLNIYYVMHASAHRIIERFWSCIGYLNDGSILPPSQIVLTPSKVWSITIFLCC